MMLQFEVLAFQGRRFLYAVNTERYDFWVGFRQLVKELP